MDTEPDYTNPEGIKWWSHSPMTNYALLRGLLGVRAWKVERPDGYKTYLLTKDNITLLDDQTFEGMGIKIDLLAFQKRTENEQT